MTIALVGAVAVATLVLQSSPPGLAALPTALPPGPVHAWGNNAAGHVDPDNPDLTPRLVPQEVPGLATATAVAAGSWANLAVVEDGSVWAWGPRDKATWLEGQPNPLFGPQPPSGNGPSRVGGLPPVASVFTSYSHALAVTTEGKLWAWGDNRTAQLGTGSRKIQEPTPAEVPIPEESGPVTEVSAGAHSTLVVKGGRVWGWGSNGSGQLGNGNTGGDDQYTPAAVKGAGGQGDLETVRDVAVGFRHGLAVTEDGQVWAWGDSELLGRGPTQPGITVTPVPVMGLPGDKRAVAVGAGSYHSLALLEDGTVWSWGYDQHGALGDGDSGGSTATDDLAPNPVQVKGPGGAGALDGVADLAVGPFHNLARKADGTVWGWGANADGQLGDGTTRERTAPVQAMAAPGQTLERVGAVASAGPFAGTDGPAPGGMSLARVLPDDVPLPTVTTLPPTTTTTEPDQTAGGFEDDNSSDVLELTDGDSGEKGGDAKKSGGAKGPHNSPNTPGGPGGGPPGGTAQAPAPTPGQAPVLGQAPTIVNVPGLVNVPTAAFTPGSVLPPSPVFVPGAVAAPTAAAMPGAAVAPGAAPVSGMLAPGVAAQPLATPVAGYVGVDGPEGAPDYAMVRHQDDDAVPGPAGAGAALGMALGCMVVVGRRRRPTPAWAAAGLGVRTQVRGPATTRHASERHASARLVHKERR